MSVLLTPQQQDLIDSQPRLTARVVDSRTNAAYVLVPEADYEVAREILEDERRRQAIHTAALRNAVGRMNEA